MKRLFSDAALPRNAGLLVFFMAFAAVLASALPMYTNDGPAHVGIANFLANAAADSLASQLYIRNESLHPNIAVYLVLAGLMQFVSIEQAESVVQLLALLGPPIAAYFLILQIHRDRAWLAILVLPLSINQCFFLGLYNFCFSITAFFLALAAYVWMQKSGAWKRALLPIAMLYLAFFAHAAGFIAAVVSIACLSLVRTGIALHARRSWDGIGGSLQRDIVILLGLLPLASLMIGGGSKGPMIYGTSPQARLFDLASLRILETNSPTDAKIALVLNLILIGGVLWGLKRLWQTRAGWRGEMAGLAGAVALVAALVFLALVFPDVMGGGWTHFLRMCLFPALVAPLCFAYLPLGRKASVLLVVVAVGSSSGLLASALRTQSKVKDELVQLAAVDRIIGKHCSVLPLILEKKPQDQYTRYSPYFHLATRLEHQHDRIALFNFIVRLDIYPVQYREGRNVQELIFGWQPAQRRTAIQHLDIGQFEQRTGIPVDYFLRWGSADALQMPLKTEVAEIIQSSTLVYGSQDGRIQLYRRPISVRSRCTS